MASPTSKIANVDGTLDFSQGVDSHLVTTLQSQMNPNGMPRNMLPWLDNATVRNGGITQRLGWNELGVIPSVGLYQGSFVYSPPVGETPYHVVVIQGQVWKVPTDNPAASVNLSAQFGISLPLVPRVWFCQAERFLVIQAGDGTTLPLFWDDAVLRQSVGITDLNATIASPPHTNEIPSAQSMCYYMGRLWYAQGRQYSAGDMVGGPTGTLAYDFTDAVLCVQENPLCVGGDGFTVPTQAGNITAIGYAVNINSQLGQGQLYIGTRTQVYALTVPVTRSDWIAADKNNQPLQVVALSTTGWVNDRSLVQVNGDLFFLTFQPGIQSMTTAIRNFGQWGNVPISVNESRVLQFNDRSLMQFSSGIFFDNRLLMLALPELSPVGAVHAAIIPLNFDTISSFNNTLPPVWEGVWEGLPILEVTQGDYGGRQRAFATVWSSASENIQLWEFTTYSQFDNTLTAQNRVSWNIEFLAFTWGDEFQMKKLVGAEIWYDGLYGTVEFQMQFRPDGDVCWHTWHLWKDCAAGFMPGSTQQYPLQAQSTYAQMINLPVPPLECETVTGRPTTQGYQFQPKLTIKGYCRIRALYLYAENMERKMYLNIKCFDATVGTGTPVPPCPLPKKANSPIPPDGTFGCPPPTKANSSSPADGASGIDPAGVVLTWADGGGSTSFNVYLNGVLQGTTNLPTLTVGALNTLVAYPWRVDSVNACGVTTGDTWTFTTSSGVVTGMEPFDEYAAPIALNGLNGGTGWSAAWVSS